MQSLNSSFDSFTLQDSIERLNKDLLALFFNQLSNAGRVKLSRDPIKSMEQIGFIRENKLTFAALLLFGEHKTNIHIGRFKSNDIIIDDVLIKSPLIIAVDEAMTFIKKSISLRYDFNGNLRRKETWQYPLSVIRELLLNSVIHKDYRNPTDVIIKIFDNKIVFANPGNLMAGLKPENLLTGEYLAVHRNKLLAEAFYLRGDIEKFGSGYYRMRSEINKYPHLELSIESIGEFTKSSLTFTMQDTMQDKNQIPGNVQVLVLSMDDEMKSSEIMNGLGLVNRDHFRKEYLKPAFELRLIEMTIPEKPNSKNQKYKLTKLGISFKNLKD